MRFATLGLAAAAMAAALAATAPAHADVQVFSLSPVTGDQNFSGTLGLDFTVDSAVSVTSLGAFTDGATPISVTLYDLGSSTAVASATIPAGAASSGYIFDALSAPVLLAPGSYQIAAYGYGAGNLDYNPDQGGSVQATFDTDAGALTQGGAYYSFTPGVVATTFDAYTSSYGAGDFTLAAVPVGEPASIVILGASLVGLGLVRRERR